METSNPSAVLDALPELSHDELVELRDRAAALLALSGRSAPAPRPVLRPGAVGGVAFERLLYEAFCDELYAKTRIRPKPWTAFCGRGKNANQFIEAAHNAQAMHDRWFPDQSASERAGVLRTYARLCLSHIENTGGVAFWSTIARTVENLPEIVDNAFPGYAAAGLLYRIQPKRSKA